MKGTGLLVIAAVLLLGGDRLKPLIDGLVKPKPGPVAPLPAPAPAPVAPTADLAAKLQQVTTTLAADPAVAANVASYYRGFADLLANSPDAVTSNQQFLAAHAKASAVMFAKQNIAAKTPGFDALQSSILAGWIGTQPGAWDRQRTIDALNAISAAAVGAPK